MNFSLKDSKSTVVVLVEDTFIWLHESVDEVSVGESRARETVNVDLDTFFFDFGLRVLHKSFKFKFHIHKSRFGLCFIREFLISYPGFSEVLV